MTLDRLDYILAVAEEQTVTRAAKRLYVSQPTLTNYINKLEQELGVKLFDRTVTPVRVTRAGALYIERMKKIQQESDSLVNELKQMGQCQTVFNLGIGSTRGSHWLPYVIPEFCRRHPDVTVQLHEKGEDFLEKGVLNGEIDLAIGVLNTSYPDLSYEELIEETVYLAIPRSFDCVNQLQPWMATPSNPYYISADQIGTIPFLLPYPGSGFYRCATMQLEQAGLTPGREVRYGNMNTAYQLAGEGVGAIFITPSLFLEKYPDIHRHLAFCSLQNPPYTRRSVAGFCPDNRNLPLIREMIALIRENILPKLETV